MKKGLTMLLAVLIGISVFVSFNPMASAAEPIKIGVNMPMTGVRAVAGEWIMDSLRLRQQEINEAGGLLGRPVELLLVDNQSDPTGAINAMQRLIADDEIVGIIGPHATTTTVAVADIAEETRIPIFSGGTSTQLIELNNRYLFRARASDDLVARVAAEFMVNEFDVKNVGIIHINDEFGIGGADIMTEYLDGIGVKYTLVNHNATDQDLTGQILQLRRANVDGVIVWSSNVTSVFVRQAYQLGLDVPTLVNSDFASDYRLAPMASEEVAGLYSATDMSPDDPDPAVAEFVKKYEEVYGMKPEAMISAYYGALTVLADAIERAGSTDREAVTDAIYETEGLQGILDTYNVDSNGGLVHQCVVLQIDESKEFNLIRKYSM